MIVSLGGGMYSTEVFLHCVCVYFFVTQANVVGFLKNFASTMQRPLQTSRKI